MLHQFIMYIQCLNTENIPVRSTIFAAVVKIGSMIISLLMNINLGHLGGASIFAKIHL